MTTFHELLDNPQRMEPGPLQARARQEFPSLVSKNRLEQRRPGDPIPSSSTSNYVIIGIASYSPDELRLLDDVAALHPKWEPMWKVAVFDVSECKDVNDVRTFLPGIRTLSQTPVVQVWESGKVVDERHGLHMTREALRKIGILPKK